MSSPATIPTHSFVVGLHDVRPRYADAIQHILSELHPLIGPTLSAAVIAAPAEGWTGSPAHDLLRRIETASREILSHGLTHERAPSLSPFSYLVSRADEFRALSRAETERRLHLSRTTLASLLGQAPAGFIPPAWQPGHTPALLAHSGHTFLVGMSRLTQLNESATPRPYLPLATWSWDAGRVRSLWRGLDFWGNLLACRSQAVPCIVIHPQDLARNLLPHALQKIRTLLAAGHTPTTYEALLLPSSPPASSTAT